jgi:succinate dehydrogenase / fumarate reductase iron-sulfur subunit
VSELNIHLHVWRQPAPKAEGRFVHYEVKVTEHASFLEMLDILNDKLIEKGEEPIAFDSDCREGICGTCGFMINGVPHGPQSATTTCQLHMRTFKSGDEIWVEPFRARAFPVLRDLVVDRGSFDRIIQSGGFISVRTGSAPEANNIRVPKGEADTAFDAAACIGCGACVAACPNASASLFTSAKIGHLGHLPQGQPQRERRALAMVTQMDQEGFGSCTNHRECEAACPKEISIAFIARMNRDYMKARLNERPEKQISGPG